MTKPACPECDKTAKKIREYCDKYCWRKRFAKEKGLTQVDLCHECPLRAEQRTEVDKVLAGETPEPPPEIQEEIIRGLS